MQQVACPPRASPWQLLRCSCLSGKTQAWHLPSSGFAVLKRTDRSRQQVRCCVCITIYALRVLYIAGATLRGLHLAVPQTSPP